MKNLLTILIAIVVFTSCQKPGSVNADIPACIKAKIAEMQAEPVRNPAASVWQFEYNGQTVYYIPPYCCDFFGEVYNSDCQMICAPDGGLHGNGDGRCPDFATKAKNKKLIWKDNR